MKTYKHDSGDSTLADLSREPVRKCEPSDDFASDVIVFL